MKDNKIFDFSRLGFQNIINIMTKKINECVDIANGMIPRLDDYISKIDWNKIINSDLYQKVLGDLGKTKEQLDNIETKNNFYVNIMNYNHLVVDGDWINAFEQAISDLNCNGELIIPNGVYEISRPITIEGATHYTSGNITLKGESLTNSIIKCNSNNECVLLLGGEGKGYNISLDKLTLDCNRLARCGIKVIGNALVKSKWGNYNIIRCETGVEINCDAWQNDFGNPYLSATKYGFRMLKSGTSNNINIGFAYGCEIGWELRGSYSSANSLACDNYKNIAYNFLYGDWTINSLGAELSSGNTVVSLSHSEVKIISMFKFFEGTIKDEYVVLKTVSDSTLNIDNLLISTSSNEVINTNACLIDIGRINNKVIIKSQKITNINFNGSSSLSSSPKNNYIEIGGVTYNIINNSDLNGVARESIGNNHHNENGIPSTTFNRRAITWCDHSPKVVNGKNFEWQIPFPSGSLYISQNPHESNVAGFIRYDKELKGATRDCSFMKIPVNIVCTSKNRPTRNLYVGLQAFDSTLGKPIWCKSTNGVWVNSDGVEV